MSIGNYSHSKLMSFIKAGIKKWGTEGGAGAGGGTITALNNGAESRLVTIGSTTTELDGESGLTYDGSAFTISCSKVTTTLDLTTNPLGVAAYNTDGEFHGTVLKYNPGTDPTTTLGQLYYLHTNGVWTSADASAVASGGSQLLGIALGTSPRSNGMLIKGIVRIPDTEILNVPGSNASPGLPIYVSTTAGHLDFTAPNSSGDFVRVAGYALQDSTDVLIYFDPDPTWIERS